MPVVIVIGHGHAQAVTASPGDRRDSGSVCDVLEGPVTSVAEETVAIVATGGVDRPALDAIDVEPAVAVEIEQAHATRHGLGQEVLWRLAIVEGKAETDCRGVVGEFRTATRRLAGGLGPCWSVPPRVREVVEVGESISERGTVMGVVLEEGRER